MVGVKEQRGWDQHERPSPLCIWKVDYRDDLMGNLCGSAGSRFRAEFYLFKRLELDGDDVARALLRIHVRIKATVS